ncbi:kinase-like domain-containing protein [Xylariaceae sp. FL1651]|nr:kinase-like domain-containing protein [Xylariaceae sp. FL1651]
MRRVIRFESGPPPRADVHRDADTEAQNIRQYFERNPRFFEYVGFLNNGVTGVSCKVKLKPSWWRFWKKPQFFVVKRAFKSDSEDNMENEVRILEELRGALHILQPFHISDDIWNPIQDAPGLSIITEWVENGTLSDFVRRAQQWDRELPNRLLLKFFMCLVRFCIAMAWPPRKGIGATPQREKIPEDASQRQRKHQLRHGDMHCSNVMIDRLIPDDGAHEVIPILKLIDFDQAHVIEGPSGYNIGVKQNIYDIGSVMRTLISRDLIMLSPPPAPVVRTTRGVSRTFYSCGADLTSERYPNLDPDLAALVKWCMAANPLERPSIELLHSELKALVKIATPARYRNYPNRGLYESNGRIRWTVQQLILDPP